MSDFITVFRCFKKNTKQCRLTLLVKFQGGSETKTETMIIDPSSILQIGFATDEVATALADFILSEKRKREDSSSVASTETDVSDESSEKMPSIPPQAQQIFLEQILKRKRDT
mmetsp:Transcript_21610/g.33056  ORF Transcript_21610/g.33056 Transcript_21610/m.33056 type:complete len:113 (+) Transcript_21610:30-368(+)